MRLYHVNTLQPPFLVGGAERTVATVSGSLAQRGHQIRVFSLAPDSQTGDTLVDPNFRRTSVELENFYWPFDGQHRNGAQRLAWHLRDAWNPAMGSKLAKFLDEERPDALLTHNIQGWSCNVWQQANQRNIPVVHVIHDQSLICPQTAMFRNGNACSGQCFRCMALSTTRRRMQGAVSGVIAVSKAILERNRQYGMFRDVTRTKVIHNSWRGDWPEHIAPLPLRSAGGPITVGFMGRVEGEKGIDTLCEGASILGDQRIKLLIAGQGKPEYIEALKRQFPICADAFLGAQKPEEFFPKVDIVVVPSRAFEGLGNVAFEALVFGRPVIVSDQGGLPEIPDAECGDVVPSGRPKELAELLLKRAANVDDLEARSKAALARSLAFHPDRQADAYESFLREICAVGAQH